MKNSEWIETILPNVADRLYEELLALDPVPKEYAATPVTAATYHLSRHVRHFGVTPVKVPEGEVRGVSPKPCKVPPRACKPYSLAEALLACQKGTPGVGGAVVFDYIRAARAAHHGLVKIVNDLSPPTHVLVNGMRPVAVALSEDVRSLLRQAISVHNSLIRARNSIKNLGESIANVLLAETTKIGSGKKHGQDHLDRITASLLGCYSDKEIAEMVPDGEKSGENNEAAIARVANRRKKLTGSRKGGRFGRPGRPRKTRRET